MLSQLANLFSILLLIIKYAVTLNFLIKTDDNYHKKTLFFHIFPIKQVKIPLIVF